ncbi:hypothetical protein CPter91_4395 [Collimonas pratensis]|uniref:Uncharacterized protein n=1 Tax=Collimonas pratensis TaxID=279113 RepID=A0A127QA09_9BURK|nr:hypothetical protein CPter91_4395 [Collimonas pratensis]
MEGGRQIDQFAQQAGVGAYAYRAEWRRDHGGEVLGGELTIGYTLEWTIGDYLHTASIK